MSFRIALSGLGAAKTDLSVSANNIANSNTNGFKSSRAEFADIVASSGAVLGSQFGDGVRVAEVAQKFTDGNISFTGNPLDLAITGDGFFRLSDNGAINYSRAGAFNTDRDGFLVNSFGHRLTGFSADANGQISGLLSDLRVDTSDVAPRATSAVTIGANLDAGAADLSAQTFDLTNPETFNNSTSLTVFDSLGNAQSSTFYFKKGAANTWEAFLSVNSNPVGLVSNNLVFDSSGRLTTPASGVLTSDPFTPPGGAAAQTLSINIGDVSQFGSEFGVNFLNQDGFPSGQLANVEIEEDGMVFARYTNSESLSLGQVGLATFSNLHGLTPVGDNAWVETLSSGPPVVGTPLTATFGAVQSGALEDSNVELTEQLVNIINAQRNFQANAQVITASDALTQTILNIR